MYVIVFEQHWSLTSASIKNKKCVLGSKGTLNFHPLLYTCSPRMINPARFQYISESYLHPFDPTVHSVSGMARQPSALSKFYFGLSWFTNTKGKYRVDGERSNIFAQEHDIITRYVFVTWNCVIAKYYSTFCCDQFQSARTNVLCQEKTAKKASSLA